MTISPLKFLFYNIYNTNDHGDQQHVDREFHHEIQADHSDHQKRKDVGKAACRHGCIDERLIEQYQTDAEDARIGDRAGDGGKDRGKLLALFFGEHPIDGTRDPSRGSPLEDAQDDRDHGQHFKHGEAEYPHGSRDYLDADDHPEDRAEQRARGGTE